MVPAGSAAVRGLPWLSDGGIPVLAAGTLGLNLMDALFTLIYGQLQLAEEVNPMVSLAYCTDPGRRSSKVQVRGGRFRWR